MSKGYFNAQVKKTGPAEIIVAQSRIQTIRCRAVRISQTVARGPITRLSRRATDLIGHRGCVVEQTVLAETGRCGHLIQERGGYFIIARVGCMNKVTLYKSLRISIPPTPNSSLMYNKMNELDASLIH